ncbi:MAG: hypothetical protein Kow0068_05250 [Marinilabiliales bacterium]
MGLVLEPKLRSVLSAWTLGFINYFISPAILIRDLNSRRNKNAETSKIHFWKWIGYSILPILIFVVFIIIYKVANPKFSIYVNDFWINITEILEKIFINFTWGQFFFILFGATISIWFIYKSNAGKIFKNDKSNNLERQHVKSRNYKGRFKKITALKREYIQGIILLSLLNALILIVNIIDISWIWFDFELIEGMDLKQLVHEGTYLLIIAILLSVVISLYFFRGNINFYKNNKTLKYLTYTWLAQNFVMVISVAIRNMHYIHYFGLAYKRIGVMIFLLLTCIGLITVIYKIWKKKTGVFLFRINAFAVYLIMILLPIVNWDILITKHNMKHPMPENIEADFLLNMSDETLYYLYENKHQFLEKPFLKNENSIEILNDRINKFINKKQKRTWLSFSLDNEKSYNKLIEMLNSNN